METYKSVRHKIADEWASDRFDVLRSSALDSSFTKYVAYVLAASGVIVIFVLAKTMEISFLGMKAVLRTPADWVTLNKASNLVVPSEFATVIVVTFLVIVGFVLVLAVLIDVGDDNDKFQLFTHRCEAMVTDDDHLDHTPEGLRVELAGFVVGEEASYSLFRDQLWAKLHDEPPSWLENPNQRAGIRAARKLFRRYKWYVFNKQLTYALVGGLAFLAALCAAFFLWRAVSGPPLSTFFTPPPPPNQGKPLRPAEPPIRRPVTESSGFARHPILVAALYPPGGKLLPDGSPLATVWPKLRDALKACVAAGAAPRLTAIGYADSRCVAAGCGASALSETNKELANQRAEELTKWLAGEKSPAGVSIASYRWPNEAVMRRAGGFRDLTGTAPASSSRPARYDERSGQLLRRTDLMIDDAGKCELGLSQVVDERAM